MPTYKENEETSTTSVGKIVGWSIFGLIVLITFFSSWGTVAAGNIGVRTRFF